VEQSHRLAILLVLPQANPHCSLNNCPI